MAKSSMFFMGKPKELKLIMGLLDIFYPNITIGELVKLPTDTIDWKKIKQIGSPVS